MPPGYNGCMFCNLPCPGLGPELEAFHAVVIRDRRRPETTEEWLARLGGYVGPPWLQDGRKRPLRVKWHVQTAKIRANMRRRAVTRMRLSGLTFREIGRELGISHVRARVFWAQVCADVLEQAKAEARGRAILEARERFDRAVRTIVKARGGTAGGYSGNALGPG